MKKIVLGLLAGVSVITAATNEELQIELNTLKQQIVQMQKIGTKQIEVLVVKEKVKSRKRPISVRQKLMYMNK